MVGTGLSYKAISPTFLKTTAGLLLCDKSDSSSFSLLVFER